MVAENGSAQVENFMRVILEYRVFASGLRFVHSGGCILEVHQVTDSKSIQIDISEVSEILSRFDSDQKPFLQINFQSGKKILITESFIGFKPLPQGGIDLDRLPRVVTTPDLVSVFEAIEESMTSGGTGVEIETLKKVFLAILSGGEQVGFNLVNERDWIRYVPRQRATA